MLLKLLFILSLLLWSELGITAPRHSDPDGCMSCHELDGLDFIDENGVRRSSTINKTHYYSSLHGSVPCKDCHRKITEYPHEVENGEVDCSDSCHVEEPSEGEAYTHKPVLEEFENSVHNDGWYKAFTGGNRLEEIEDEQDPSCRRCHSNTLYILESQLEKFKDLFAHTETECGTCHQGEVWLSQFGGHILRRFIGARWRKQDMNKMCTDCHADLEKMAKVEIEDKETGEKKPASTRFIHAVESYDKTLHGRLLISGMDYGASCIDCHAPKGLQHEVRAYKDEKSTSHLQQLPETCAQSDCHGYAKNPANAGFVTTDMHDLALLDIPKLKKPLDEQQLTSSGWFLSSAPLLVISGFLILGSLWWWLFIKRTKKILALFGGERFETVMIGRKPKKARAKPAPRKPRVKPIENKQPEPNIVKPDSKEAEEKPIKKIDNSEDDKKSL